MRQVREVLELLEKAIEIHNFKLWNHETQVHITFDKHEYQFTTGRDFTKLTLRKGDYKSDVDVTLKGEMDALCYKIVQRAISIKNDTYVYKNEEKIVDHLEYLSILTSNSSLALGKLKKESDELTSNS
jgi:hypothetical protein